VTFQRTIHLPGLDLEAICAGDPNHHSVVVVLHGLGVSKEVQLPELNRLRAEGFFALAVDAPHHGSRNDGLLDILEREKGHARHHLLLSTVLQHASEISQLTLQLRQSGKKVCVNGISMGGHVAFSLLRTENRPDLIAPFIATPDFRTREDSGLLPASPAEKSGPADFIEQVFPASLFMVAGGLDTVVSPVAVRSFAAALSPYYADSCPEKLEYHEYEHSGHMMRPADWFDAWSKFIERLRREGF
jgi:predicted esterase